MKRRAKVALFWRLFRDQMGGQSFRKYRREILGSKKERAAVAVSIEKRYWEDKKNQLALHDGSGSLLDFSGADLSGADFKVGHNGFVRTIRNDFSGANLSGATLGYFVNLSDGKLKGVNFTGEQLDQTILTMADLSGANLWRANLIGANLRNADISDANLRGAGMYGTDLAGADLTGALGTQTDDEEYVKYDYDTLWPDQFKPPNVPGPASGPNTRAGRWPFQYWGRVF